VTLAKEPSFLQEFSGLGLLLARPLTADLAKRLPRWAGTRTAGGELFLGRRPDSVHFILVGNQSLTEIMPATADCGDDTPNLAQLSVTWSLSRSAFASR
jgi:hypothetical protein